MVTGGGTGLGRSISHALAAAGFAVAISYRHSEDAAFWTVERLQRQGVQAIAIRADLNDPRAPAMLVKQVVERFGRIDVLVNNAAETAHVAFEDLDGLSVATWDRIQHVDLRAPLLLVQAAAPWLKQAHGCVINIASIAGLAPRGSSIAYSVAKAALIHLSKCLAVALAPSVRVVAVAPGNLPTQWGRASGHGSPEEHKGTELHEDPLVRSVAEVIVAVIGNISVTGSVLVVDRGELLGLDETSHSRP